MEFRSLSLCFPKTPSFSEDAALSALPALLTFLVLNYLAFLNRFVRFDILVALFGLDALAGFAVLTVLAGLIVFAVFAGFIVFVGFFVFVLLLR